jgi:hypothetical protein
MAKLRLKKEHVAELTTDDLVQVAGGAQQTIGLDCLSILKNCQSINWCTTAMSCGGGCEPTYNCQ